MRNVIRFIKYYIKSGFRLSVKTISGIEVLTKGAGNEKMASIIECAKPCSVIRLGTTEATIVKYWMDKGKKYCKFPAELKDNIYKLSGFFPPEDQYLNKFCNDFVKVIENSDLVGVRSTLDEYVFWDLEHTVLCGHNMNCSFMDIKVLTESINFTETWTEYLKGKRVLIIHPFDGTIKSQFAVREKLFSNQCILPEFDLITLKAVQSLSIKLDSSEYSHWFSALDSMKFQIDNINFDIALIGAGAYGMFLADHCKRIGKIGIHVGGALQLLFGIKGKRWEDKASSDYLANFYNEFWVYPSPSETPVSSNSVENGCYWK